MRRCAGTVVGVLSGDSLAVRFDNDRTKCVCICLEHVVAPRLGDPEGRFRQDETVEHDSFKWSFMINWSPAKKYVVS